MTFTPAFDQRQPGLVRGYDRTPEPETVLVAGLPRLAAAAPPAVADLPSLPPIPPPKQSNLIDLDTLAADLHREGFCLWLRHDGEEFDVELNCGVDVLPGNVPRPRGRGVAAQDAISAAVREKARIVGEQRKGRKAQ